MTITQPDGTVLNAMLLARDNETLRVLAPHDKDVRVFRLVTGGWVDEENEPVKITFAWEGVATSSVSDESEFICSPELASRLIELLAGSDGDAIEGMFYEFAPHRNGIRVRTSGRVRSSGGRKGALEPIQASAASSGGMP
jgi:hypothetical protein